jgi:ribosomal protein L12E/L44/L45/RPP1/RPP2
MKYLSAYALAWLSGKSNPSAKDLEAIITSVGGHFDKAEAEVVLENLTERDVAQAIRNGLSKLQTTGGAAVSAGPATTAADTAQDTKKEDKKDDKKDEEADFDGALDMFGGDDY